MGSLTICTSPDILTNIEIRGVLWGGGAKRMQAVREVLQLSSGSEILTWRLVKVYRRDYTGFEPRLAVSALTVDRLAYAVFC